MQTEFFYNDGVNKTKAPGNGCLRQSYIISNDNFHFFDGLLPYAICFGGVVVVAGDVLMGEVKHEGGIYRNTTDAGLEMQV